MVATWNQKSMQATKQEEKIAKCPDCKSTEIEYRDGERYCKKCGLVLD